MYSSDAVVFRNGNRPDLPLVASAASTSFHRVEAVWGMAGRGCERTTCRPNPAPDKWKVTTPSPLPPQPSSRAASSPFRRNGPNSNRPPFLIWQEQVKQAVSETDAPPMNGLNPCERAAGSVHLTLTHYHGTVDTGRAIRGEFNVGKTYDSLLEFLWSSRSLEPLLTEKVLPIGLCCPTGSR